MSHLRATRSSLREARRMLQTLMSLGRVPSGDPTEREVENLFRGLNRVIQKIHASAGEELHETGPLVFPVPGVDPRDFPTSLGGTVRETLLDFLTDEDLADKIHSGLVWTVGGLENVDVLTLRQYKEVLRAARPYDSADELCLLN